MDGCWWREGNERQMVIAPTPHGHSSSDIEVLRSIDSEGQLDYINVRYLGHWRSIPVSMHNPHANMQAVLQSSTCSPARLRPQVPGEVT